MSSFSNLKFELITTGEQSGQWGNTTNTNIGTAIEQAIVGMATLTSADFSSNVGTLTLANANTAQNARALCLVISASSLSAAGTLNVPAIQKPYLIINNDSYAITVKVSGLTGVSVPAGKRTVVYNNGTDVGNQIDYLSSLTLGAALPIASGGTGSTSTTFVNLATNVTGTLPVANGGTGQTTLQNAMDALAGAVTSGQYLRGNGTDVVMSAIQSADVPVLNQNTTGTAAGLSSTLAVTSGGTGQTSYTDGQLLIGNSTGNTLSKATLTAGTNVTITNSAGGITIASSNSGGTVTSVVGGTYLTGGTITTSGTLAVDATSANTASKVVARDASGNFTAGVITSTGRQEIYGLPTNAGTVAGIYGGTSNGTIASPTQTTTGQDLFKISGVGYTGTGWTGGAALTFVATDNFTASTRGTNVVLTAIAAGGGGGTNLVWNGTTLVANGTTLTGNTGTVTSVGGTGSVNGLTLTGTVTTSGNLTLGGTLSGLNSTNFAVQGANLVLAGPNGSGGSPTFRSLVAADIPTLNQNTTGTAGGLSSTLAIASGGTGSTTLAGASIVTYTGTETLTNKRITARVNSQTTTASPWAWNSDSYDQQQFTALANALTINADAGTPTNGQQAIFRFVDNGTAQALTWTTGTSNSFRALGTPLPTTTVASKTLYVGCVYNSTADRWDVLAVAQET